MIFDFSMIDNAINETRNSVISAINTLNDKQSKINDMLIQESVSPQIQSAIDRLKQQGKWLEKYRGRFRGNDGFWIDVKRHKFETDEDKQNVTDVITIMKALCDESDYETYLMIRKAWADILSKEIWWLNKRVMFANSQLGGFKHLNEDCVAFMCFDSERPLNFKSTDRLFHTSNRTGLTQLQPTFRSVSDGEVETLYPSMRVYFSLNGPINRTGLEWNKQGRVYEYTGNKNVVIKQDTELGKPGCFIETTSPVPIKDVTEEVLRNPEKFVADFGW